MTREQLEKRVVELEARRYETFVSQQEAAELYDEMPLTTPEDRASDTMLNRFRLGLAERAKRLDTRIRLLKQTLAEMG